MSYSDRYTDIVLEDGDDMPSLASEVLSLRVEVAELKARQEQIEAKVFEQNWWDKLVYRFSGSK
jgi:hypothetical protein